MALKWENLGRGLKRLGSVAFEKSEELTKVGKIKLDIMGINKNIDRTYRDLGERVYQMITGEINFDVANDPKVKELISRMKSLEDELKLKEEELERVKEERR